MGWDLVELWRQGRFLFLLALIDHLPRTSAYAHAVANDEEIAAELADHQPDSRPQPPPTTEWTPEVEALSVVINRIGELINTVIGVNGGKPHPVKQYPHPVTEIDRARKRRTDQILNDLAEKLRPTK